MKITLTSALMLTLLAANEAHAIPGDDFDAGGTKICRHANSNNQSEFIFAVIPMNQECPSYAHTEVINNVSTLVVHGPKGQISYTPMQDVANPTCWNEEIVLPTD